MSQDILVRKVPDEIVKWIDDERYKVRQGRNEFIISLLSKFIPSEEKTLSLFQQPISDQPVEGENMPFSFIDLFAGIGGFRTALSRLGGHCVFSSEWDRYAQKTYAAWYGETPVGDIREVKPSDIPDHDILAAGFPCQPFSIAGVSKKNSLGRLHGFKDIAQGTLFFTLATIAEIKRPPVLFLENVKNLKNHDGGNTWSVIRDTLEALDYKVFDKIIDAIHWVPQHRERIIIVCFDRHVFGSDLNFRFPDPPEKPFRSLADILDPNPDPKYTLTDHLWQYLQTYARKHREKGNGFGFGLIDPNGTTRTLSARYYKDGSEILIPQKGKNPRRLTPREAMLLMGFPSDREIVVSDTQAYRQFGNAVVPLAIEAVGRQIINTMKEHIVTSGNGCILKSASIKTGKAVVA